MKVLTKNGKLIIADGAFLAAPSINLQEKTVQPSMEDQTVTPDSEFEGLSSVVVKGDANLVPENIAKDTVIFGITGTHQGGEDVSAELTEQDELIEQIMITLEDKAAAGMAEPFAFISATYPEGSTCTCTNGTTTLTADAATNEYVFCVPNEGTWTVASTDGSNSKEENVEILTKGQLKTVSLFYFEYIINKGKLQEGYDFTKLTASYVEADGYAQFKTKTGTSGNGAAVIAKNNAILDLTKNSLLRIELEATSTRSGTLDYFTIGTANLSDASTGHTVSKKYNLGVGTSLTRQIINLPIDNIDAGYLSLVISDNTGTVDLRIYNIWFE